MVEVEQIEPQIFVYRWVGIVSADDIKVAAEKVEELSQGQPFAAIVDMRELGQLPYDITRVREMIRTDLR